MSRAAQGLRAWLLQRLTAVYIAAYLLIVILLVYLRAPLDYRQWNAWLGQPLMGAASALFAFALLLHVWVGVRDILIDYVHAVWFRLLLMSLCGLVLLASLIWTIRALALAATGNPG